MPERVVLSDASTLIGLSSIDALHLLKDLYGRVEVTTIVQDEASVMTPWLIVNDSYDSTVFRLLASRLDDGEASAIALALTQKNCLLIIDERKGGRQALALGLKITGLVGVIIKAKERGLIDSGKDKLDELLVRGFRLSPKIYTLALKRMQEN
ncbi:DUF3368 domain-containing protein [Neolewinella sp.]|uniref:DUF3368 domain-containing protein n=1 Tax=Neolewinella sp. TaxID=2993543 RepID=UPI003B51C10C